MSRIHEYPGDVRLIPRKMLEKLEVLPLSDSGTINVACLWDVNDEAREGSTRTILQGYLPKATEMVFFQVFDDVDRSARTWFEIGLAGVYSEAPNTSPEHLTATSCCFCGRSSSEAKKLIAGRGNGICDQCIVRFATTTSNVSAGNCAFCGLESVTCIRQEEMAICSDCLALAQAIIQDEVP